MTSYFLGADIGATKTHVLIADETGQAVGFGQSGPGNHELVGYDGLQEVLSIAANQAWVMAGIAKHHIAGAGFGVAGLDWPSQKEPILRVIDTLGLTAPVEAVNDALIGLLVGSAEGWGIAIESGTGCNCWGWDRTRRRVGHVTGASLLMGEAGGASELIRKAIHMVAYEWTRRGPATQLTPAFIKYTGAQNLPDLLQGLTEGRLVLNHTAAPLVFAVAAEGDPVALEVVHWAGSELGELAKAVIRQLNFEAIPFDVVMVGSLFKGGSLLVEPMRTAIHALAPQARLVRLNVPPVVGAVLLGMEQAHLETATLRPQLITSTQQLGRDFNT